MLFMALTAKTALTAGAVVGGTIAVIANRDKLLEITAAALQRGADYLNHQIEKNKVKMACDVRTGEYARYSTAASSEATTPATSDDEYSDTEDEKGTDAEKGTDDDMEFMRHEGSTSTLVLRGGLLVVDAVD